MHQDSFHKKATLDAIPEIPEEQIRFETDADETFIATNLLKNESAEKIADALMEHLEETSSLLKK